MGAESRHVIEMLFYQRYHVKRKNDGDVLETERADLVYVVINIKFNVYDEWLYTWHRARLGISNFFGPNMLDLMFFNGILVIITGICF